MKRILISIVVLVGISGLIGLLTYHPGRVATVTAAHTASPSTAMASPTTMASSAGDAASAGAYKDGTYTGTAVDTAYGTVQIKAVITGGKISGVAFAKMPSGDSHTNRVTSMAEAALPSETIQAQSANVNNVSGATQSTDGFKESLGAALSAAKA